MQHSQQAGCRHLFVVNTRNILQQQGQHPAIATGREVFASCGSWHRSEIEVQQP